MIIFQCRTHHNPQSSSAVAHPACGYVPLVAHGLMGPPAAGLSLVRLWLLQVRLEDAANIINGRYGGK